MGFTYLSVGDSSSVQYNTQQLSNGIDTKYLQHAFTYFYIKKKWES